MSIAPRCRIFAPALTAALFVGVTASVAQQPAAPSQPTSSRPLVGIDPSATMTFSYRDVPVSTILTAMSEKFGFVIISGALPQTRVTVQMRKELSGTESISTLNEILAPLKYVALISNTLPNAATGEKGSTILRIVLVTDGVKGQIPVYTSANPDDVPTTDELRTQIMPIKTISAVGLVNDLRPLIAGGDITASSGPNAIVITDTAAKIHRLAQIIYQLDNAKKPATEFRYRQLVNASAGEVAQLINSIFSSQNTNAQQVGRAGVTGTGIAIGGPAAGAARGQLGGGGGTSIVPRLYANSDARTNLIILTGPEQDVQLALEIINRLEAVPPGDLDTTIFLMKNLNNANAGALTQTLNQIFGNATNGTAATATSTPGLTMNSGNTLGTTGGNRGSSGTRGSTGRAGS
jgi:type II secretory pathway component GspD/PulD (secretin)